MNGLPAPSIGKHYSKLEVLNILTNPNSLASSSDLLTKIMDAQLVPVKRRQMNKLVSKFKTEGMAMKGLHKDWGEAGRAPLLTFEDVNSITNDLKANSGFCLDDNNISDAISNKQKENMEARGIQPLAPTCTSPSDTSVRNYKALIGSHPGVSIARTAKVKSYTRYIAEKSLLSAMAFVVTAATTHYTLSTEKVPDVYKEV